MNPDRIKRLEHSAFRSELTLKDFCEMFEAMLGLPAMKFYSENETEWAEVEYNLVGYNVSRPYITGTLQKWDGSVPDGCNFGISLSIFNGHKHQDDPAWIQANIVEPIAGELAKTADTIVYYHRTWLGPGKNEVQNQVFKKDRDIGSHQHTTNTNSNE